MATPDYNRSRFWVPNPGGFVLGNRVLRFGLSATSLAPSVVETLTNTLIKPGKTAAAPVLNRVLWADDGEAGLLGVYFGQLTDNNSVISGVVIEPFESMYTQVAVAKASTSPFGPQNPANLVTVVGGDPNWTPFSAAQIMTLLVGRTMARYAGVMPVDDPGKDYDGVWRIGAGSSIAGSITEDSFSYVSFAGAARVETPVASYVQKVYPNGRNVRLYGNAGTTLPSTGDVPKVGLNQAFYTATPLSQIDNDFNGNVVSTLTAAGEHPIGDRVRSIFGIAGATIVPGYWSIPKVGNPFRVNAGVVHGIHPNVQSMAFDSDDQLQYVFATFSRQDIVNVLVGQKSGQSAGVIAQIDAIISQIGKVSSSIGFNLLISPKQFGPYDIYDSKTIVDALANGASKSDIDSTMSGGTSMADWRVKCLAMAPSSVWLWGEQTNGSNYFSVGTLYPITDAPFWAGYVTTGDVVAGPDIAVAVNDTTIAAVAAQRGLGQTDTLEFIEELLGRPVEPMSSMQADANGITLASQCPWLDMPGAWMKRCMNASLQPIANGLAGSITEPLALFTTT